MSLVQTELSLKMRDRGVDLENRVSQLASLIYVELGQDLLVHYIPLQNPVWDVSLWVPKQTL